MANIPLPLSSPKSPRQPALLQHHTHHHHHNHHHHSTTPPITSLIKTLILEPNNFSPDSAQRICLDIFNQHATPAQISAFIVALRLHSLDKKPEFVHACADALRQVALPLDLSSYPELASEIVDIVGTGGDGHDTFNVSTAAAIVAAGAGCKVAKHGNRASSSQTGSADLLEAIGCKIEHFSSNDVASTLEAGNFCFLFATKYHPALRIVSAIRKEIGIPSIFNLLGPMINPARPRRIVVGVHSPNLGSLMVEALKLSGVERAMVVCGADGLDEVTPAGETRVWNLYPDGTVAETMLHPRDFGLPTRPLTSVRGGHPARNASLLREILNSNGVSFFNPTASDIEPSGASAEEKIATLDFVLMNAAALIVVAGKAEGYAEAVELARESLASGNARAALDAYAQQTLREYLESMKSEVQD